MNRLLCCLPILLAFLFPPLIRAQEEKAADFPRPTPNTPTEPLAKEFSMAKATEYLDNVAVSWTREKKCGTCHTNCPYMIGRPLAGKDSPGMAEVRKFFESRVGADDEKSKIRGHWEITTVAGVLAINDHFTTGKLHPLTKKALDKMWTQQQDDGGFEWVKCGWPPIEHDDYYGAVFVALAVGLAPDGYAKSENLKDGLTKLRAYFQKTPVPSLHHKAFLLWASYHLDGLMTKDDRDATVKELLAKQRPEGGWSLPSLGDWKGRHGRDNDVNAPSDGYGTGLAVYVLRQAGIPANDPRIQKGVTWLKTNQRESGRWFTRSLNTDKDRHYIANAGSSYAVMALKACE